MSVDRLEATDLAAASPKTAPRRRIILLSGEWRFPGSRFALEGTVFVGENGGAQGDFFWMNVDTPDIPADMAGTELVSGTLGPMQLELEGYQVDPYLACDRYRIRLLGDAKGGAFVGETEAYHTWEGRISGDYRIVEQPG